MLTESNEKIFKEKDDEGEVIFEKKTSEDKKPPASPIKIICVLKTSKIYNAEYVDILHASIKRNTTVPFEFICMSNYMWSAEYKVIPLINDWPNWWPKVEMFKYDGKILTMDLDTLIVDNIDDLLDLPNHCGKNEIFMMKAANPKRTFTTSIMAWNGSLSHVYDNFSYGRDKKYDWDQYYILKALENEGTKIHSIQEKIPGIYSYKRQWRQDKPKDTRIIWFHGKPRIHEVTALEIVNEHWTTGN